ncbi:hypothetical protein C7E12_22165, partial [Stenotrophomonas maltophilia]
STSSIAPMRRRAASRCRCRWLLAAAWPWTLNSTTQQDPTLDRPIYQYIQHRADATPCGQPLQMPLAAGRSMAVDIEQY